jgi:hypothetical protein
VTTSAGTCATTAIRINGATLPASSPVVATNSSAQVVAATGHGIGVPLSCADVSGSGSAQSCTTSPTFTPVANDPIIYTTTTANTGALTINVNAVGPKPVKKWLGAASLVAGDLPANTPVSMVYDGINWEMNTIGNVPVGVSSAGLSVNGTTTSGIFTVTGSPITNSGTLNFNLAGTNGHFPYFTSSSVLSNDPNIDDGITSPGVLSYNGGVTASGTLTAGGATQGLQLACGTAASAAASYIGLVVPSSCAANYGNYSLPLLPTSAGVFLVGAASSNVSTVTVGAVPLTSVATQNADTVLLNNTASPAAPTAVPMPTSGTNGCAGTSNALTYNTTTHALGCNTISTSGSPGGATTQMQFNGSGSFAGASGVLYDNTKNSLTGAAGWNYPATTIDVYQDSPGTTFSSGTLIFSNGSQSVTTSTAWSTANIGTIIEYNSGSSANCTAGTIALAPCFRAVVISITDSSHVKVSVPFPGATTGAILFASGPTAGTWDTMTDVCSRLNASVINHPSAAAFDMGGFSGTSQTCSVSPWNGTPYGTGLSGGKILLGSVWYTSTRQWWIHAGWTLQGTGKVASNSSPPINTFIIADNTNYASQTYSANNLAPSGTLTTSGTTFTDTNGAAVTNIIVGVSSTTCDTGVFGHFTLSSSLAGFVDSSQIHFQGITGNTGWNGTWMLVSVSGNTGEVQFNTTCPTTGTLTAASADLSINNQVQYKKVISTTDTAKTAGAGTLFVVNLQTGADFAASDVGSCTLTATAGTFTNPGPFTVVANSSSTSDTILTTTDPGWGTTVNATITKTCWGQGTITGVAFQAGSGASGTGVVLTTNTTLQLALSSSSANYWIGGPLINPAQFTCTVQPCTGTNGNSIQGVNLYDLYVNMNGVQDSTPVSLNAMQEQSSVTRFGFTGWTAYGMTCELNCAHVGPVTTGTLTAANIAPPTAVGIMYADINGGSPVRAFDSITLTANSNGSDPYECVSSNGNATSWRGIHCERYGINFSIGRYGSGNRTSRGVSFISNDPGIGAYDGYKIWNASSLEVSIIGSWMTNSPGHDFIEDLNFTAACASGTTDLTAVNTIALYSVSTSGSGSTRFSSDPTANNCFGPSTFETAAGVITLTAPTSAGAANNILQLSNATTGATTWSSTLTNPLILSNSSLSTSQGSGLYLTGSALTVGTLYYQAVGGLTQAKADVATTLPAICLAIATTQCLYSGVFKFSATQGWPIGGILYVSDATAGAIVTTAPSTSGHFVQRVGIALAADTALVMPSLDVGGLQ